MSGTTHIKKLRKEIESLCDNCDRPDKEQLGEIILSSMASGFSVGLEASYTDRPSEKDCKFCRCHEKEDVLYELVNMESGFVFDKIRNIKYCPLCGACMKGTDNE